MTTPAVDTETLTYGKYTATYVRQLDTEVIPDQFGGVTLQDYEHRPASAPADKIKGFKKCAGWSHRGVHAICQDGRVTRHLKRSIGYYDSITYDGSIWNMGVLPYPELASPNQVNRTLVKALNRLKEQDFHLGNFIATARDTNRTVANGFGHIAKSVRLFRKSVSPKTWELIARLEGNIPRYRWCEIPSAWLELQYGWKPLLQDILGALTHLYRESRYGIPYVEAKATTVERSLTDRTIDCAMPTVTGRAVMQIEQRCDVFLVYGLASPVLAELSSLGLINPVEIVWEVLPYSFVVDWAVPIQEWLGSLSANIGYEFITGGQSRTSKLKQVSGSYVWSPSAADISLECEPPKIRGKAFNFERSCYGGTPVPGIYVKNPISPIHVANAMSLLVEAFR